MGVEYLCVEGTSESMANHLKLDSAHMLLPGIYWKTKLLYDKAETDSPYRNEIQNKPYF